MARFAYRCMKCRTRNMFKRRVEGYVRPRKCKSCGSTSFYWDKARNQRTFGKRDDVCYCQSPYGRPHRRGSRWCEHNKLQELHIRADLQGEDLSRVFSEMAFDGKIGEVTSEPPF